MADSRRWHSLGEFLEVKERLERAAGSAGGARPECAAKVVRTKFPLGEVARMLGVSRTKLWQMIRNKEIPYHQDSLDHRRKLIEVVGINDLLDHNGGQGLKG
jgi:excisionase family DNA binding protein